MIESIGPTLEIFLETHPDKKIQVQKFIETELRPFYLRDYLAIPEPIRDAVHHQHLPKHIQKWLINESLEPKDEEFITQLILRLSEKLAIHRPITTFNTLSLCAYVRLKPDQFQWHLVSSLLNEDHNPLLTTLNRLGYNSHDYGQDVDWVSHKSLKLQLRIVNGETVRQWT